MKTLAFGTKKISDLDKKRRELTGYLYLSIFWDICHFFEDQRMRNLTPTTCGFLLIQFFSWSENRSKKCWRKWKMAATKSVLVVKMSSLDSSRCHFFGLCILEKSTDLRVISNFFQLLEFLCSFASRFKFGSTL